MDRDRLILELRELLAQLRTPIPPGVDPLAESARRVGWTIGVVERLLGELEGA